MGAVNLKGRCSPAEWETRVQLAACYRLLAKFRMTDLTSRSPCPSVLRYPTARTSTRSPGTARK